MKRFVLFALCTALLLSLMGCGSRETVTRYTLNPDGSLNKLRWGMTFAQAAKAEKGIAKDNDQTQAALEHGRDGENTLWISLPPGEFLENWAEQVRLRFSRFPSEGESAPLRLVEIQVLMGPEADKAALVSRAEAALTALTPSGHGSFASSETLGDRIGKEALSAAYPEWSAVTVKSMRELPLVNAAVSDAEYDHKCFSSSGYCLALAEAVEK